MSRRLLVSHSCSGRDAFVRCYSFSRVNASEMTAQVQEKQASDMLIVFRVGELRLGIDVRQVREVARAIPLAAPLPNSTGVAGMVTLRGEAAAVIDVNALIGAPCDQRDRRARMIAIGHDGATVCLLVDQIEGLRDVNDTDLEPPPQVIADLDVWWLDFVLRCEQGDLVGVVNLDRILSKASLAGTGGEAIGV